MIVKLNDEELQRTFAEMDVKTILYMSSSRDVLKVRKLFLESFGLKVIAVEGQQGIDYLLKHPVDAAILDYQTPGTNGELVAIKIKMKHPRVPIVMVVDDPSTIADSVLKLISAVFERQQSSTELLLMISAILQDGNHREAGHSATAA